MIVELLSTRLECHAIQQLQGNIMEAMNKQQSFGNLIISHFGLTMQWQFRILFLMGLISFFSTISPTPLLILLVILLFSNKFSWRRQSYQLKLKISMLLMLEYWCLHSNCRLFSSYILNLIIKFYLGSQCHCGLDGS